MIKKHDWIKFAVFSLIVAVVIFAGVSLLNAQTVTRGPYLQMGNPNEISVRWRTNVSTDSRVGYGTTQGTLNLTADDLTATTEHEIRLTGLTPNTRYYYSIGTTTATLAGNDANHFFVTPPTVATDNQNFRFWILGDAGTNDSNQRRVRDAYYNFNSANYTNGILMLGDNAYNTGTDSEYQAAVFDMYSTILRQSVLYPTIGNHDTAQATTVSPTLPYFQMFTLPTANQSGGAAPSGTEKYYAFDYGNIHFICLDSQTSSRLSTEGGATSDSAMVAWLKQDLAQTSQKWIVAFWHHPPYTKGTHDSDTETQLIEMRRYVLPVLENNGVDLVLAGHSHVYERSFFIDGHYGLSSTFTASMKKATGNGQITGPGTTGAYTKPLYAGTANVRQGAVYITAGRSGASGTGLLNHPAMIVSSLDFGSVVLDVNKNRMDVRYVNSNDTPLAEKNDSAVSAPTGITDSFTIIKSVPTISAPQPPENLSAAFDESNGVKLRWEYGESDVLFTIIERCENENCTNFSQAGIVQGSEKTFTDATVQPNRIYAYRVKILSQFGSYSDNSNLIDVSTFSGFNAPSNLRAKTELKENFSLFWLDNATVEEGFLIENCTGSNCKNFAVIGEVAANTRIFKQSNLRRGIYRYRVTAFKGAEKISSPIINVAVRK